MQRKTSVGYWVAVAVGSFALIVAANVALFFITGQLKSYLFGYESPLVMSMAIASIVILSRIQTKKPAIWLQKLSAVSFDVYIIHGHVLVMDVLLAGRFGWVYEQNFAATLLTLSTVVCTVYFGCSAIGLCRASLFKLLRVSKLIDAVSRKADALFEE